MDRSEERKTKKQKRHDFTDDMEEKEEHAIVLTRKEAAEELLGQVVHSEEEAYKLYCDYSHRVGFSVRKGKQSYFLGTKNIRTKDYYCSKEGIKYDEPVTDVNFNRPDTRTNCKAMIRYRVDEKGEWSVVRFVPEHNHELAKPGERHLLKSARSLAKHGMDSAVNNTCAGSYRVAFPTEALEEASDGMLENALVASRECYNQPDAQGIQFLEAGDIQSLLGYFKRRANEEGLFYWDTQVDQEGRVTNFFWRDSKNRNDFDCFGDVVLFDTSYNINQYWMVCAPFVGVNHHWQNVVFGCAFLLERSKASYTWLFKTFLSSMGGKGPRTIFTDYNEAMAEAIEETLPETHHCFCHWLIQKSVQTHIPELSTCHSFLNAFSRCVQGCHSEVEFEEAWAALYRESHIQENPWFAAMYKHRHKWCMALNQDAFDGGINSLQWSENYTNMMNGISDESTCLTKFVFSFEKLLRGLRRNEFEEDFKCSQTAPVRAIKHSAMLKHASEVYTHKVYKIFEAEYLDGCGASSCEETSCGNTLYRYELTMHGRGSRVWIVSLDTSNMEVTCNCKKFETTGILCSHTLKAFSMQNIDSIPDRYILKRWTKDARRRIYKLCQEEPVMQQVEGTEAEQAYRNRAMHYAHNLVTKSQELEESRKIFWDTLESGEKALDIFFEMRSLSVQQPLRDKDGNKIDRRKKNYRQESISKKLKQPAVAPSTSAITDLVTQPVETQFYPPQDAAAVTNPAAIGLFYQAFQSTTVPTNQIYIPPNMQPMTLCASQEMSAFGAPVHPSPSTTFGGTKNISRS
ncbi:FAR1-related sequence 1 [Rhynchospora pubera]|uniref:FAR1-related sequence 1 n=1 Tax=Rhynchospora pubera TaxID=906938 RepID=A0AAV8HFF2_9POAL|nr:FAR1-related sequence 1 [Rhynchospora pubera]